TMFITGTTQSEDFPTTGEAYYPDLDKFYGGSGPFGFLTRMSPDGKAVGYSSYLQNRLAVGEVHPVRVAVDPAGNALVAGFNAYGAFPTTEEAFSRHYSHGENVFLMRMRPSGSEISYATHLGGDGDDRCDGLALLPGGTVWLSGSTYSTDFPTSTSALSNTNAGSSDLFAVALSLTDTMVSVPDPVENLTANATATSIRVDWDQVLEPVFGYRVYKAFKDTSAHFMFLPPDDHWLIDYEVSIGVEYEYTVVVVNDVGPGAANNTTAIPWTFPSEPLDLEATAGCSSVLLEWSPPSYSGGLPVLGYLIYRGTTVYNMDNIGGVTNGTKYLDTNVSSRQVYYYYVRAFNERMAGMKSAVVSVVPYGVPERPMNVVLVPGDSYILVSWDEPFEDGGHPVTMYTIYRGLTKEGLYPLVSVYAQGRLEYLDMGLANGVDYYYMITATNLAGEGPGSTVVSSEPRGAPGPPIGVHTMSGNGRVTLKWSPPTWEGGGKVNSYRIYRGLEPGNLKIVSVVPSSINEYTDHNVGNGYTFYYAVQAMNSVGVGEMSAMVTATPFGPPTWPTTITIEPGLNRIILSWTPPKDDGGFPVEEYEIYRGPARMHVTSLVRVDGNLTEYVDTDVKVGVVYYYRIIVTTAVASSSPSWVVAASPYGPPTVPSGITIIPFPDRVLVSWGTPVHDGGFLLMGYHLYVREDVEGSNWTKKATIREGTNHMLRALAMGKTYVFKVTAFNDVAEGPGVEERLTIVGQPEPPRDLRAVVVYGDVYLEWSAPSTDGGSAIEYYEVTRSDNAGVTYLLGRVKDTAYVDEFPYPGTKYTYTVVAVNVLDESEPSKAVTTFVPEQADPEFIPTSWIGTLTMVVLAVLAAVSYGAYRRKRSSGKWPGQDRFELAHNRIVSLLRR
ncbi:MAG: fibronectin type III domain-containing protein, partial [Thermoplasmata archaeon]